MAKPLIIGINGSSRKIGNTARMLKEVLDSVEKHGGATKIIHLADHKIKPCAGHYSTDPKLCKYPCKIKDDMGKIQKQLFKADGIVFASPVYWFNISGIMKNFLDRMTCLEGDHYYTVLESSNDVFYLENKVAGFIVSEEEAGAMNALSAMIMTAMNQGMVITPYSAVYGFSETKKNKKWGKKDLLLLGKNMLTMVKAQKYLEKKCPKNWPFPWDYKCKP